MRGPAPERRAWRASLAQLLAEAADVRGRRTAARYLAWAGRRLRQAMVRRGAPDAAAPEAAGPGSAGRRVCPSAAAWCEDPGRAAPRPARRGGLAAPAFDPCVDNPVGWTANVEDRVFALGEPARLPAGARARRIACAEDRAALRLVHHVEDVAAFHPDTASRAATLVRLTARGVPVRVLDRDPALAGLLGMDLYREMAADLPLGGLDQRAAASVRLRRAALRDHGFGLGPPGAVGDWGHAPTVSVLLATRRPERLAAAVRAVVRQDYPRVELVLALHGDGFGDLPAPGTGLDVRVLRIGAERTLGEALAAAAALARGELLAKMDDDDRYDAHHLLDLVLAHGYSGAQLVGKGPEVVYLAGRDVTVRRGRWRAERFSRDVAGGALLIARADLVRAGGWRPLPRGVDQALAADVEAMGGAVYRTHGSGFVLMRHGRDHAWKAEEKWFLTDADEVHRGWRPDLAGIGDEPCRRD